MFLELTVQLVNSQIITKTIKVAAENAAVIWASDGTELAKVKRVKNVCVSVELPVVAFQPPTLTEGHRLCVTDFHAFHKHPLASVWSAQLCPESWPVTL